MQTTSKAKKDGMSIREAARKATRQHKRAIKKSSQRKRQIIMQQRQRETECVAPTTNKKKRTLFPAGVSHFLKFLACPHNGLLFPWLENEEVGQRGRMGYILGLSLLPPTGSERRTEPGLGCAYCRLRGRSDAHLETSQTANGYGVSWPGRA